MKRDMEMEMEMGMRKERTGGKERLLVWGGWKGLLYAYGEGPFDLMRRRDLRTHGLVFNLSLCTASIFLNDGENGLISFNYSWI